MVPTERVHGRGMYSGWAHSGPKAGHTLVSVAGLHAAPQAGVYSRTEKPQSSGEDPKEIDISSSPESL